MYTIYKLYFDDMTYYIGVTNNLKRRLYEHKNKKFTSYEILHETFSEQEAYNIEKFLVPDHKERDALCRNLTMGGRHPFNMRGGIKHTQETKEKISKTKAGKTLNISEENREKLRKRMIENNPAQRSDVRKKLSAQKLKNNPRKNKPGTMLGKQLTDEQHSKISYKVNTPDGVFQSTVKASKYYNCSQQTIVNRCNSSKFTEWYIVEKGKKYV